VNTVVPTTTHHGPEEHPMDEADPVPLSLAAADPVDLWEMSIGELVDRVAADHPDRAALVFATPGEEPRRWTYRELVDDSVLVARALLRRFSPGDHVAVWAPNCAEWILLQHGAARAGVVLVTVNPAYVGRELAHVLRLSRAVGLFLAPSFRGTDLTAVLDEVRADLPDLRDVVPLDTWEEFVGSGAASSTDGALPTPAPGDAAMIQFTSGTTAAAKSVLLSHRGIVNSARLVAERAGFSDGVVSVNAMPLFHIGGCGTIALGTLCHAGTQVLAPGFVPGHILELLETHRATVTLAVPTMLIALLEHPDRVTRDLTSLETVMTGGASVPAELVRRVTSTLGVLFTITFGQTETSGPAVQTSIHDSERDQAETIGRPLPGMEARIADIVTGDVVPCGTTGEIQMRGPLVMLGYYGQPDETARTVDVEGWLHTGDLGTMDERGFLTITGRSKDLINRGGEKIGPREIEDVLFGHPAVSDVAVIGLPDERYGERVAAVIRLRDNAPPPTETELVELCTRELARYKVPVEWHIVTEFPQTPSGKIQKFKLREEFSSAGRAGTRDEAGAPTASGAQA
jgi:fatty-acyl-CoA synthase